MTSSGSFLLSHGTGHVRADGVAAEFDDAHAAVEALRSGRLSTIVGALPFDTRGAVALTAPHTFGRFDAPWRPDARASEHLVSRTGKLAAVTATITASEPEPAEHVRRIAKTVDLLADPADALAKVVLARAVELDVTPAVTPWWLAAELSRRDRHGHAFVTDLSPAGDRFHGRHLVGASPEMLIGKQGMTVSCHPLAGSAPRDADPDVDAARGRELISSAKDLREHRYVVDALREALAPLCTTLDVPGAPELVSTPRMWHLGTPIRGTLADPSLSALDLALAVHPTPAVCGTPTAQSRDHILALEGDRRFYGGAVGWSHRPDGAVTDDGQWWVAIRCAEIAADGHTITTWAGGGIVDGSDPDAELRETSAKLRTVLDAFGLTDPV